MTEATDTATAVAEPASTGQPASKKSGGLNSMLMADLKQLAGSLGIKGTASMRKGALVEAISSAQSGGRTDRTDRTDRGDSAPHLAAVVADPSTAPAVAGDAAHANGASAGANGRSNGSARLDHDRDGGRDQR